MLDPAFLANATASFDATPATGPYTLAMSNSALFLSLSQIAPASTLQSILGSIQSQLATAPTHLPASYHGSPELTAGYLRQLSALASFYAQPKAPSVEIPFATGTSLRLIMLHPLSRGTVRLNATHPLEQPVVDYRTGSNPFDFQLHLAHLKGMRAMWNTPTMKGLGAVEVTPGVGVQSVSGFFFSFHFFLFYLPFCVL